MEYLAEINHSEISGISLLRLDLNTEDDWRLNASLPTIKLLLEHSAKIIILSHKGRPTFVDPELSLKGAARDLEKILGRRVVFLSELDFPKIKQEISSSGEKVFLLENLRFLPGEENNDELLAKELASLGDFYVNDAFAVSHRANASVEAITKYLPSYAGIEMRTEMENLSKVMQTPEHPFVLVLGGAKAEDKLEVVRKLQPFADSVLMGGVPANTLMHLKGIDTNSSPLADNPGNFKEFLDFANIILPEDWKLSEGKIWDIGDKTAELYCAKIKNARTIVWNGPMGFIEKEGFEEGTKKIIQAIAENKSAFSLIGGGETVMYAKKLGLDGRMSFVSTGGGAMLEFLAGKELPGIKALTK